ncbi:hypothetical protein DFJ73DRAFT_756768 [Zopfochytrium polystomum]|nr:hypothetical protein DFJ73DRAFT_756768 [Zopfochytrium polystomum]
MFSGKRPLPKKPSDVFVPPARSQEEDFSSLPKDVINVMDSSATTALKLAIPISRLLLLRSAQVQPGAARCIANGFTIKRSGPVLHHVAKDGAGNGCNCEWCGWESFTADSQEKVEDLKESLNDCKELLQCKRFDLLHLWIKSVQYKEMTRILDVMSDTTSLSDSLQRAPEKIDGFIQTRQFLPAVRLLMLSLRLLAGPECVEVGALEGIRQRLNEIKEVWDSSKRSAFSFDRIGKTFSMADLEVHFKEPSDADADKDGRLFRGVDDARDADDADTNPETDSYTYMGTLIECLTLLGRLPEAIELLKERLPLEIYFMVERCIQETDARFGLHQKSDRKAKSEADGNSMDLIGIEEKLRDAAILRDLLANLFRKLECAVMGHDFVLKSIKMRMLNQEEATNGNSATSRALGTDCASSLLYPRRMAKVKSLLYDYLTTTEQDQSATSAIYSVNEALKEKKGRLKEKVPKRMKVLRSEGGGTIGGDIATGIIDKYANVIKTGHRLLIDPDFCNVLVAYKPTVAFVEQVDTHLLRKSGTFSIFLDDFILNVFLPQMEDRILDYFHSFVNGSDAFVAEHSAEVAGFPVAKCAVQMTILIQSMCRTLFAIPVHKLEFVRMIEMILVKFYDKLLNRFRTLMSCEKGQSDRETMSSISAGWACEDEIVQLLLQNTLLLSGETYVEMHLKKERSFHRMELIFEPRKLQTIAQMHFTMDWFIAQVTLLRVTEQVLRRPSLQLSSAKEDVTESISSLDGLAKLSVDSLPALPAELEDDVQLPLNTEMTARFDAILNYYQELSETFLYTLRVELRCHAMYFLDLAMREGNYYLEDEPVEPDAYIDSLNQDLILVEEARINKHGVSKLIRNVQALQQSLTNIVNDHDKDLDRVKEYFSLLKLTDEGLLDFMEANTGAFSFDEYKVVLDLMFQERDDSSSKKSYRACLERLKTFFVSH